MNLKFVEYFRENFFQNESELKLFINSLTKNLTKTLRVNTSKISIKDLKERLSNIWYELKSTFQENVFYIEKNEQFDNLERRLWFSIEHLLWFFYIQELWASSSVYYLSGWKIDKKNYLILDMAASPGWKTTQLAEYYPNSFIVANEFDKNRTPQLIANIDRMWLENYWITNYNWQFLWRYKELFDKILLDAPCSWEWTWFKSLEALKYRNIKNVKKMGDLQKKLIEAWFNALKIWWEMLYSTCTMNKIENEWVIKYLEEKYPGSFEILFEKRFWPHIDETWWFFVCKIKKLSSIGYKSSEKKLIFNDKIEKLNKKDYQIIYDYSDNLWINFRYYNLLKYNNEIISIWKIIWNSENPYEKINKILYFFKLGKKIWHIKDNVFIPNYYIGRDFWDLKLEKYLIENEQELDNYLRGFEIWNNIQLKNSRKYLQIKFKWINIWLWEINEQWTIKNLFPKIWMRK